MTKPNLRLKATPIQDFNKALGMLVADPLWRTMLAENLYWASMEGFLQSSLLAAFNAVSNEFLADRERTLSLAHGKIKPDLLVFARSNHNKWWSARAPVDSQALRSLAEATFEFKVAWTKGNATGSATLSEKVKTVRRDALKARQLSARPGAVFYVGVLVSGFHPNHTSPAEVRSAVDSVAAGVRGPGRKVLGETTTMLLDDYFNPGWNGLIDDHRTVSSALWMLPVTAGTSISTEV